jgi:hypothetical protein
LKNWVKWVSVGVAVSVGICITKNPNCLWAFFIPCFSVNNGGISDMGYNLHMFLRKITIWWTGRNCGTCKHYDGRLGDDTCFLCERSVKAVGYERK